MLRLERITSILLLLQSRKKVTAQYLADHFGTSVRTIYRDVRVLEEAGVPIGAEAGHGYFLLEGYQLPPVMFTKEEAAALLTGEKLLEKLGDASINRDFKAAMNKIRAVLRSSEKDFLETLEQSMAVFSYRPKTGEQYPNHFISSIQQALVQRQVVQMEYFSHYNNEINQRKVEPVGLCFISGNWHLIAYCRLRKDFRDFRADRIRNLHLLEERFEKRKHKPLIEYLQGMADPKALQKVIIRFDQSIVRHLHEQKFYFGLVEEKQLKSQTEMTFLHPAIESFARWLIMWEDKSEVVGPPELTQIMRKLSKAVYEHYKK